MRCCDSLPPISPRFVSFAWRYHRCVRCSSPPAPDAEPWINLELVGGISSRRARWKRQGLPSSRRNPCDHSPYSSDPGVTKQAEWTMSELPGAAPATDNAEGSPRVVISGLNRTAFDLAVYASQGWSPTRHARLTFPTKVLSDSLGRIGSLKRTSDKSLFQMALGSCGHRITHQLRPINMNGRSILSETSLLGDLS